MPEGSSFGIEVLRKRFDKTIQISLLILDGSELRHIMEKRILIIIGNKVVRVGLRNTTT